MVGNYKNRALTEELGTLGSLLRVPFEAMLEHNWARVREQGFDDLRIAHGAVFRNISAGGSRITELAARSRMTKQSMAELVAYLQKRGYVDVSTDPDDKRGKLVTLTERGVAAFEVLAEASNGFEDACERRIGRAKWQQFRRLLTEVASAVADLRDEMQAQVPPRKRRVRPRSAFR
ncbi:MAG TPA: MarR family transcriptional regulator, partial [Dehalococcoidia bacterium]|nr:MarR family transcriptional regulator [Dehalococcoidia bacterium]